MLKLLLFKSAAIREILENYLQNKDIVECVSFIHVYPCLKSKVELIKTGFFSSMLVMLLVTQRFLTISLKPLPHVTPPVNFIDCIRVCSVISLDQSLAKVCLNVVQMNPSSNCLFSH